MLRDVQWAQRAQSGGGAARQGRWITCQSTCSAVRSWWGAGGNGSERVDTQTHTKDLHPPWCTERATRAPPPARPHRTAHLHVQHSAVVGGVGQVGLRLQRHRQRDVAVAAATHIRRQDVAEDGHVKEVMGAAAPRLQQHKQGG